MEGLAYTTPRIRNSNHSQQLTSFNILQNLTLKQYITNCWYRGCLRAYDTAAGVSKCRSHILLTSQLFWIVRNKEWYSILQKNPAQILTKRIGHHWLCVGPVRTVPNERCLIHSIGIRTGIFGKDRITAEIITISLKNVYVQLMSVFYLAYGRDDLFLCGYI